MAFNATQFRQQMKFGGYRPNLFDLELVVPEYADSLRISKLQANAASLPGYTTGFVDTYYFGRRVSFIGDRQWEDWEVQITIDEDMKLYQALQSWNNRQNLIDHDTDKLEVANPGLYADIRITPYKKTGEKIDDTITTLKNAFPIQISPIQLAWQENNTIAQCSVIFRYDYLTTENIFSDNVPSF